MKTQKEIEKGCGKYDEDNPELCRSCGDILFNNTIWYCPTCQALLQHSKDIIEEIDKFIQNNKDWTTVCYGLGIKESMEELKSSIIGSEEKK